MFYKIVALVAVTCLISLAIDMDAIRGSIAKLRYTLCK